MEKLAVEFHTMPWLCASGFQSHGEKISRGNRLSCPCHKVWSPVNGKHAAFTLADGSVVIRFNMYTCGLLWPFFEFVMVKVRDHSIRLFVYFFDDKTCASRNSCRLHCWKLHKGPAPIFSSQRPAVVHLHLVNGTNFIGAEKIWRGSFKASNESA